MLGLMSDSCSLKCIFIDYKEKNRQGVFSFSNADFCAYFHLQQRSSHALLFFFKLRLFEELLPDATGSDNPEKEEFTLEAKNPSRGSRNFMRLFHFSRVDPR